jgi:signal transduction histidine kinase
MSPSMTDHSRRPGTRYGGFAYASVILACYGGFLGHDWNQSAKPWTVLAVFVLGAIYAAVGILSGTHSDCRRQRTALVYFPLQCAIVTAIVFVSPIRGFMGIIVLPIMSQAIFDLRPRYATLIGLYLFGLNIALWGIHGGWESAVQAVISYGTGFVFTAVFTVISKQAIISRDRETQLRKEVEAANQQLRDQAAQMEELATTRERNRVAREIHDGVGHYLTVVKTQLDAAAALMPSQPDRALEAITKAAKLAGDALDDVRRSVGALRADATRPPLPDVLRALTQEAGLPVTVRIEGEVRPLAPGIEHALFRSAQEGLTNVRKHAAASAAELALDFRPANRVKLAVIDNGRGAQAGPAAGFGLLGIRERIEVLGGHVESGNRSDGGFALTIEVPA